jgi:FkbH-like protein
MNAPLKCLVWDLDDTLWSGTLIEGDACALREGVRETIRALDARGVLQSVASRSDAALSTQHLRELDLFEYFLHPQMSLEIDKPDQILSISEYLSVDLRYVGLIDDDPFARGLVGDVLPDVSIFDASQAGSLASLPAFAVATPTAEAAGRRAAYRADEVRRGAEAEFSGPRADFLRTCKIVAQLAPATAQDVVRIAELSLRTNRMNASERRFDTEEVARCIESPDSRVQLLRLSDRFGELGAVGATLIDCSQAHWQLRALMVSCRALGRGVGEVLLVDVLQAARSAGAAGVEIHYASTPSNRGMGLLFASQGFQVVGRGRLDEARHYRHDLAEIPPLPAYLKVESL